MHIRGGDEDLGHFDGRRKQMFMRGYGLNGMGKQTFNGRFSSTRNPASLNEEWIKSE